MPHDCAGRADLAAEIRSGATTDSEAEPVWKESRSRKTNTREEDSGEGSAWGDANEPERSREVRQHVEEGKASQWRPYMQKGDVSSMDLDAICMPRYPHQP